MRDLEKERELLDKAGLAITADGDEALAADRSLGKRSSAEDDVGEFQTLAGLASGGNNSNEAPATSATKGDDCGRRRASTAPGKAQWGYPVEGRLERVGLDVGVRTNSEARRVAVDLGASVRDRGLA
jgi:hypothetical protein